MKKLLAIFMGEKELNEALKKHQIVDVENGDKEPENSQETNNYMTGNFKKALPEK